MFKFHMRENFPIPPREFIERTMYRFDEYEKFAPNVKHVDVLSQETLPDGRKEIVVRVYTQGWLPPKAQAWFRKEDLKWKEHYIIDFEKLTVEFNVETPIFTKYIDCIGTTSVRTVAGGCQMMLNGSMNIGVFPVKGVLPSVVRSVLKVVEPLVGSLVNLNMKNYFNNVRKCMEMENATQKLPENIRPDY